MRASITRPVTYTTATSCHVSRYVAVVDHGKTVSTRPFYGEPQDYQYVKDAAMNAYAQELNSRIVRNP